PGVIATDTSTENIIPPRVSISALTLVGQLAPIAHGRLVPDVTSFQKLLKEIKLPLFAAEWVMTGLSLNAHNQPQFKLNLPGGAKTSLLAKQRKELDEYNAPPASDTKGNSDESEHRTQDPEVPPNTAAEKSAAASPDTKSGSEKSKRRTQESGVAPDAAR